MKRLDDLIIKVLSLGIGLAAGIVLIAKVCFEMSYDKAFTDVEQIYAIGTAYMQPHNEEPDLMNNISGATACGFKSEVPGVVEATRITGLFGNPNYLDEDGNILQGSMRLADSCFFRIFDRPAVAGDPTAALARRGSAAVSRSFAEKLGGAGEAIGKTICNEDHPDLKITIDGVFEDFPKNSSFDYDILVSMEIYTKESTENWIGNDRYLGWVKLDRGVNPDSLGDAIRKMQETHQPIEEMDAMGIQLWYYLKPFDNMHTSEPTVRTTVIMLSIVSFLLVLISLLNYILIVISSMVKRSREVGVRKCYGASTADIYAMLSKEAVLHIAMSLALAAVIIFAAKGIILNLMGVEFSSLLVPYSFAALGMLVAAILAVSIIVPAQLYMRVPVHAAIKNYTDSSRRWKIGLLGVQVFINIFLAVMLSVISGQYRLLLNDDPGYDCKNLLYVRTNPNDRQSQMRIRDALMQFPEVTGVEAMYRLPIHGSNGDNIMDNEYRELFNVADNYESTSGIYEMLGIPFIDGRAPQNYSECAVDEAFVEKMNEFADWSDGAVGKTINITGHDNMRFVVSGVYRNILTGNRIWTDNRPSARFYGDLQDSVSYMTYMLVKVTHIDSGLVKRLSDAAAEAQNGTAANLISYEETMRSSYDDNRKMRGTILSGALFSLLIALLGLIGFIRDETLRRSKEIAIRKINGASINDILAIFSTGLLKLSSAMAVAACIAAYFVADKWLGQFAVRISLSPLHFLGSTAAVLAVVVLVVLANCYRIAASNPVESLKNE